MSEKNTTGIRNVREQLLLDADGKIVGVYNPEVIGTNTKIANSLLLGSLDEGGLKLLRENLQPHPSPHSGHFRMYEKRQLTSCNIGIHANCDPMRDVHAHNYQVEWELGPEGYRGKGHRSVFDIGQTTKKPLDVIGHGLQCIQPVSDC